jgi:hypothetical protein
LAPALEQDQEGRDQDGPDHQSVEQHADSQGEPKLLHREKGPGEQGRKGPGQDEPASGDDPPGPGQRGQKTHRQGKRDLEGDGDGDQRDQGHQGGDHDFAFSRRGSGSGELHAGWPAR